MNEEEYFEQLARTVWTDLTEFRKAKAGGASGRVPIVRRAERGSGADAQYAGGGRNRAAGRTA